MRLVGRARNGGVVAVCGLWVLGLGACVARGPLPPGAQDWQAAQTAWDEGEWEQALERLESIRAGDSPYQPLAHTWRIVIAAGLADGNSGGAHPDRGRRFRELFQREAASYTVSDPVILPFGFPKVGRGAGDSLSSTGETPERGVDRAILRAVLSAAGTPRDERAALAKFRVREVAVPRDQFQRFLDEYRE